MAVLDAYIDADLAAGKKGNPAVIRGQELRCLAQTFEVAAADDNGSIYRLGSLPANAIPVKCEIVNDAITGATDWDLGLYKPGAGGAVVDKDLFMDGEDINAGNALASPVDGLKTGPAIADIGKKLWELLGLSKPDRQDYDLALTANAVGSAAGTISIKFWYLPG